MSSFASPGSFSSTPLSPRSRPDLYHRLLDEAFRLLPHFGAPIFGGVMRNVILPRVAAPAGTMLPEVHFLVLARRARGGG